MDMQGVALKIIQDLKVTRGVLLIGTCDDFMIIYEWRNLWNFVSDILLFVLLFYLYLSYVDQFLCVCVRARWYV